MRLSLLLKADRADTASAASLRECASRVDKAERDIASTSATVLAANGRCSASSEDFRVFREEAKAGIILATRSANEARATATASITAAALQGRGGDTAAGGGGLSSSSSSSQLSDLCEKVEGLEAGLRAVEDSLARKASIPSVNEILETKANKTTVAQALMGKVRRDGQ